MTAADRLPRHLARQRPRHEQRGFSTRTCARGSSATEAPTVVSRARLPAQRACRRSTRTATSGCASSTRSRRCSTRSSRTLDVLDRYFHPTLAPRDVLDLLAAWLGLTRRRELARRAAARGARRARASSRAAAAPQRGLELALEHRVPGLPAARRGRRRRHLVDRSDAKRRRRPRRASWSTATHRSPRRPSSRSARVIEETKPVHVTYRLRVKARQEARRRAANRASS